MWKPTEIKTLHYTSDYQRLPEQSLTVYKNSYVKNLHKGKPKEIFSADIYKKNIYSNRTQLCDLLSRLLPKLVCAFFVWAWDNGVNSFENLVEWSV